MNMMKWKVNPISLGKANGEYRKDDGKFTKNGFCIRSRWGPYTDPKPNKAGAYVTRTGYPIVRRKQYYENTWTHAREYFAVTHEASNTVFSLVRRMGWVPPFPAHTTFISVYNAALKTTTLIPIRHPYQKGYWKRIGDTKWVQADGSRFPRICKRCKGKGKHGNWLTLGWPTACRDCGNSRKKLHDGKTIPKTKGWVKTPYGYTIGKVRSRRRLSSTELLVALFRQSGL